MNHDRKNSAPRVQGRPPTLPTTLAAVVFGVGLLIVHEIGVDRSPPPEIRRVRVVPGEAPWYILAAVEGVGPKTARRVASAAAVLRSAGFGTDATDLPALGPRLLHRASAGLETDVPSPDPPR
jgi:hypothetical protein